MIDILVNKTIVIRVYTELIINHQLKLKTNDCYTLIETTVIKSLFTTSN